MNRRPGDLGDVLHSKAVVDDGPVVAVEIEVVDDCGLIVNPRFLPRCDAPRSVAIESALVNPGALRRSSGRGMLRPYRLWRQDPRRSWRH